MSRSREPEQSAAAARNSPYVGDEMAAFDQLPERLRRALQSSVVNWCAGWELLDYFRLRSLVGSERAETWLIEFLQHEEECELARWDRRYYRKHKTHTAHRASHATVMRPDEAAKHAGGARPTFRRSAARRRAR